MSQVIPSYALGSDNFPIDRLFYLAYNKDIILLFCLIRTVEYVHEGKMQAYVGVKKDNMQWGSIFILLIMEQLSIEIECYQVFYFKWCYLVEEAFMLVATQSVRRYAKEWK